MMSGENTSSVVTSAKKPGEPLAITTTLGSADYHFKNVANFLFETSRFENLTDVRFVCGVGGPNVAIRHAHQILLAQHSHFLKDLFFTHKIQLPGHPVWIYLTDTEPQILDALLECVYSGRSTISEGIHEELEKLVFRLKITLTFNISPKIVETSIVLPEEQEENISKQAMEQTSMENTITPVQNPGVLTTNSDSTAETDEITVIDANCKEFSFPIPSSKSNIKNKSLEESTEKVQLNTSGHELNERETSNLSYSPRSSLLNESPDNSISPIKGKKIFELNHSEASNQRSSPNGKKSPEQQDPRSSPSIQDVNSATDKFPTGKKQLNEKSEVITQMTSLSSSSSNETNDDKSLTTSPTGKMSLNLPSEASKLNRSRSCTSNQSTKTSTIGEKSLDSSLLPKPFTVTEPSNLTNNCAKKKGTKQKKTTNRRILFLNSSSSGSDIEQMSSSSVELIVKLEVDEKGEDGSFNPNGILNTSSSSVSSSQDLQKEETNEEKVMWGCKKFQKGKKCREREMSNHVQAQKEIVYEEKKRKHKNSRWLFIRLERVEESSNPEVIRLLSKVKKTTGGGFLSGTVEIEKKQNVKPSVKENLGNNKRKRKESSSDIDPDAETDQEQHEQKISINQRKDKRENCSKQQKRLKSSSDSNADETSSVAVKNPNRKKVPIKLSFSHSVSNTDKEQSKSYQQKRVDKKDRDRKLKKSKVLKSKFSSHSKENSRAETSHILRKRKRTLFNDRKNDAEVFVDESS